MKKDRIGREIIATLHTRGECVSEGAPVYGHLCRDMLTEIATRLNVSENAVWNVLRRMLIWGVVVGDWGSYVYLPKYENELFSFNDVEE